jgi:predicted transcriptional regulator
MYRLNSDNEKVYMNNTAGTIDYNTGEINIASLQPDEAGTIEISVEPVREDLTPAKNQIFVINTEDISVLMINEPSSS